MPGSATRQAILDRLGASPIATASPGDLRYPAVGNADLSDRLFFHGETLALVTAASTDPRYPDRKAVEHQFGAPEAEVRFQTQEYLDYSERGLRFLCAADGTVIGVLYFAPRQRRVPAGHPAALVDLRRRQDRDSANAVDFSDWRVGAAEASLAPTSFEGLVAGDPPGVHLAEDVLVRVAILERGETRIVLAGLDVFGLGPWDLERIRETLAEDGFDNVILAMSHTHANVDTIGFYGHYPREYVTHIVKQTVAAVHQAAKAMQPIRELRTGSMEMSLAGGRVVDLIRNGRDPGLVDPNVTIIQAIGRTGRPLANIIHLACHPEVIRLEDSLGLSPDFVGTLCRETTKRLGGQTVFLNGSLGGMLTPDTRFRNQQAAEEMGRRLSEFVVEAASRAETAQAAELWMQRREMQMPITSEAILTFLEHAPGPVSLVDGRVATEMNLLWIGDAQLITVPGELLPDLGFEIMAHMQGRRRLIVGLVNGEFGYLVPAFDFEQERYEERTGPGREGGELVRTIGLELAPLQPVLDESR